MNNNFWNNKKVFITGHTGFKGGWLSLWLQNLGANVTGFALKPPTNPSFFEVANVSQGMQSIIGDIRHFDQLKEALENSEPEFVFHLAAQSLVRESYRAPLDTYSTNVMGTVNVLEAVRYAPSVRSVVCVTSDKCYENNEWVWGYRESDPMGGFDPYSNSKGCAELTVAAYRNSFFSSGERVGIATARVGNVIGGGDWSSDRLLPDLLSAYHSQSEVNIRNPSAIRPWQHVLDPLSGYLQLAQALYFKGEEYSEGWNFGPSYEGAKSVSWVIEAINEMMTDKKIIWKHDGDIQPHEANYLKLDISKARDKLNWSPTLDIFSTLRLTLDWSELHNAGNDMRAISLEQITNFEKLKINKL